jgi:hypothetical protein
MTDFFSTDTMIGRLRRACHGKLLWHDAQGAIPTNGRFVFYELEQDGAVPKNYPPPKKRRPAQDISDALIDLRRAGHVPWDWIVDETRELVSWRSAETVAEYMRDTIDRARINAWNGEPAPLIICEARSTKGVLERIAGDYLAPITATNGQCGGFLRTDVAPHLISNSRPVLYIGDHEVGGPADSIEANTQRVLEDYCERPIEWTRIALTQTQVDADSRLLKLVIDKTDRRFKPPRHYLAVECEAVGQVALEQMLRSALDARLPEPLESVLEREKQQRRAFAELLDRLRP